MVDVSKITNLVFEGGGVGAIAYAGFLAKAESAGLIYLNNILRIAGVSSGAIAGLQVALNYTTVEIAEEMRKTDFKKFAEGQHEWIRDIIRFFTEEGFYKEEYLYRYIGRLIKAKTGNEYVTFRDLQNMKHEYHFKDLYVVTTKLFLLDNQPAAIPFIFSHEHTPNARVVDAIRASAALPIIFPPIRLRKESDGKYSVHSDGYVYIDGGLIESYPIHIFDHARYMKNNEVNHTAQSLIYNPETLGLRLESSSNIKLLQEGQETNSKEKNITSKLQYAEAILYVLRSGQQEISYANSPDRNRTIIIDTVGITSTDFNLTDQQKEALIKSGEKAVKQLNSELKMPS